MARVSRHAGLLNVEVEESPATKAVDVVVPADATAGEVFQLCIDACLAHLAPNESCWLAQEHPDCHHQVRVSTRRLRALLSLMRRLVKDDPVLLNLKARLRLILAPFGPARDLDVALIRGREERWSDRDLARLSAARTEAYAQVRAILEGPAWRQLWSELEAWRTSPRWLSHVADLRDGPARLVTDAALDRRYRRVIRVGPRLLTMSDYDLHRTRIEAKKLRYGCQFFDALYPAAGTVVDEQGETMSVPLHFAARVADLQDAFGLFNDHAVARELGEAFELEATSLSDPPTRDACLAAWQRLADLEPFWRTS